MKRFQSILFASLLTVAMVSTTFAGNITTRPGNITTSPGNITTRPGNITTLSLSEYIYITLASMIW